MTLLLALANDADAIILADRRISSNGTLVDDEYNKVCVLFCDNARLALAFTGIATTSTFDMSQWLAETLANIVPIQIHIAAVLDELRRRLDQLIPTLNVADARLSILLSGFAYDGGERQAVCYELANFGLAAGQTHFQLRFVPRQGAALVVQAGAFEAIPEVTINRLHALLAQKLSPQTTLRLAVKHLRQSADNPRAFGSIGKQCNSAVVPAEIDKPVTSTYHSAVFTKRAYGANMVAPNGFISLGPQIFAASLVAGPEIRKRDPCWCGSGMKFKDCHFKKFGAVYVNLAPLFKRPMYFLTRITFDDARPSGRDFCVASGFD
jgi:hypothetical protein